MEHLSYNSFLVWMDSFALCLIGNDWISIVSCTDKGFSIKFCLKLEFKKQFAVLRTLCFKYLQLRFLKWLLQRISSKVLKKQKKFTNKTEKQKIAGKTEHKKAHVFNLSLLINAMCNLFPYMFSFMLSEYENCSYKQKLGYKL